MKNLDILTIEDYMRIQLIYDTYGDNILKLNKELIKFVCNNDLTIEKKKLDDMLVKLNYLMKTMDYPFIHCFEIEGIEYGFIPNLDEITVAEYIDLDDKMKDPNQNLNKIAAILFRPITNKIGKLYQIEDYEGSSKYSEIMKKVNYRVIAGAIVFFCNLSRSLLNHTLTSIQQIEKKNPKTL